MLATVAFAELESAREQGWREESVRIDELAALSAHLAAATARWLELVWEQHESGTGDDTARFLAFRCGITVGKAREFLRVAEALRGLPATRAAFGRGEVTFTKVRALTRVASASSEEGLLELAAALTASQLERALRAFGRVAAAEARQTHELEYVDYYWGENGSLMLRARLAAEDGTLLVRALEAARERLLEQRREERAACGGDAQQAVVSALALEPPRSTPVEALLEVAQASLDASGEPGAPHARVVVHVDAASLVADREGRCELEGGPVVAPETARRLGCDAELVAQVERDGLPLSVGRRRRSVPPALRRLLEARDASTCCFPGCDRGRHLQAHHRHHWADGGQTSLDNLVLLCFHHHRLVHEGGYTIEDDPTGRLGFRNRYGLVTSSVPPRPPPGKAAELLAGNERQGLQIGPTTNRHGGTHLGFELQRAVGAVISIVGYPDDG